MSAEPDAVIAAATAWLGTPYRHRAALKGVGCDCLGLLRGVWRDVTGEEAGPIPPYRADWRDLSSVDELEALAARYLSEVAETEPGDVLLFRIGPAKVPRHCGILIAPNRFIHAQEKLGVIAADLAPGWARRVARIMRFN